MWGAASAQVQCSTVQTAIQPSFGGGAGRRGRKPSYMHAFPPHSAVSWVLRYDSGGGGGDDDDACACGRMHVAA